MGDVFCKECNRYHASLTVCPYKLLGLPNAMPHFPPAPDPRVAALEAEVRRLCYEATEYSKNAQDLEAECHKWKEQAFRPLGDNHHNAALCPYCSPERDKLEAECRRLRAKLQEYEDFTAPLRQAYEPGSNTVERADAALAPKAGEGKL